MCKFIIVFLFTTCLLFALTEQIEEDLAPYRGIEISLKKMESYFQAFSEHEHVVKFTIKNNQVSYNSKNDAYEYRFKSYYLALVKLTKTHQLPDVTFFISLLDHYKSNVSFPLFVMARGRKMKGQLLVPDFYALRGAYQVLPGVDLLKYCEPWDEKIDKLIWRGATSQVIYTKKNYDVSRVRLCRLSKKYPDLIDAKFTIYVQGAEKIKKLKKYQGNSIPYCEIFKYKYQMWIDGNTVSYSDSGWRFFTNSVVIKPDSSHEQWYFRELKPYVHYYPVKENLDDLVETIEMLRANDAYAEQLARQAREFAIKHLTVDENMQYFYTLLCAYSQLNFVE